MKSSTKTVTKHIFIQSLRLKTCDLTKQNIVLAFRLLGFQWCISVTDGSFDCSELKTNISIILFSINNTISNGSFTKIRAELSD